MSFFAFTRLGISHLRDLEFRIYEIRNFVFTRLGISYLRDLESQHLTNKKLIMFIFDIHSKDFFCKN